MSCLDSLECVLEFERYILKNSIKFFFQEIEKVLQKFFLDKSQFCFETCEVNRYNTSTRHESLFTPQERRIIVIRNKFKTSNKHNPKA